MTDQFVAKLPVLKRTSRGYAEQTICGYGDTPAKALEHATLFVTIANRGRTDKRPPMRVAGKPTIRRDR